MTFNTEDFKNLSLKKKLSSFDELLDKFDKHITIEDSALLFRDSCQTKVLKEENKTNHNPKSGAKEPT